MIARVGGTVAWVALTAGFALVPAVVASGCGGSVNNAPVQGGLGDAADDTGPLSALGEPCTASLTGAVSLAFACVVSHFDNDGGDALLIAVNPRSTANGLSTFYDAVSAQPGKSFGPGTFGPADFAKVDVTVIKSDGTAFAAELDGGTAKLVVQALQPAGATPAYDTMDKGTFDTTLVSVAGAKASLHVAFGMLGAADARGGAANVWAGATNVRAGATYARAGATDLRAAAANAPADAADLRAAAAD